MDNNLPLAGYLILAPFVLCVLGAGVSWGFMAYYMFRTMTGFHPERDWGRYLPFSLFVPWFFTAEGNVFRAKLLRSGGLFLLFLGLGAAYGLGLKVLAGN